MTIHEISDMSRSKRVDNEMYEPREYRTSHRMGMRENIDMLKRIADDLYTCGFEDGYERAMSMIDGSSKMNYGERRVDNMDDTINERESWRRKY